MVKNRKLDIFALVHDYIYYYGQDFKFVDINLPNRRMKVLAKISPLYSYSTVCKCKSAIVYSVGQMESSA